MPSLYLKPGDDDLDGVPLPNLAAKVTKGLGKAKNASSCPDLQAVNSSASSYSAVQAAARSSNPNNYEFDLEADVPASLNPKTAAYDDTDIAYRRSCKHIFWKYVLWTLAIGPWKFIRSIAWVVNKGQTLLKPLSMLIYYIYDATDKHMPTVKGFFLWLWSTLSLILHFASVSWTFGTIKILYSHGHVKYAFAMAFLYGVSHYLMAVIMYMELDRQTGKKRYSFTDFYNFVKRLVHVALWDIQLLASLFHCNYMMDGISQMMLKGYEESRVCLHVLVNTIPACVMLGILYDGVVYWVSFGDINFYDFKTQIYGALVFSVLNAFEKWLRFSLANPMIHPKNDDGYPLLFMRSHAASIPHGLVRDWLFKCNAQLLQKNELLTLHEIFSVYTFNCKGDVREMCDGHKAYLIRKALRTFNGANKYNRAEIIARRLDKAKFKHSTNIKELDASCLRPGRFMSDMLAEVLSDSNGFEKLSLADNQLADDEVVAIMHGLQANDVLQLESLNLSGNDIAREGCVAVAAYVAHSTSIEVLDLSGNPLRDGGARAIAEALAVNTSLRRLDLTGTNIGPDAGAVMGHMLKSNTGLRELIMKSTNVGSAGVESLARGLHSNTGLRELDVSYTGADDRAVKQLAQALLVNKTLTKLNLANTRITDSGAKVLCDALQQNATIQMCDLSGTPVDKSWHKLLNNIIAGRSGKTG